MQKLGNFAASYGTFRVPPFIVGEAKTLDEIQITRGPSP
jgi:hypothetical protein